MCEIWVDIEEYEGLYQVSNFGRVKSFHNRVVKEKILSPSNPKSCPYTMYCLAKNKQYKTVRIHLIVAKYFIPNPEKKPYINHIDGDKTNPKWDNLEWCTHKENINHAWKTGLCKSAQGENNNAPNKLTENQVKEILLSKDKHRALAIRYNVSDILISRIKKRKAWKHVKI